MKLHLTDGKSRFTFHINRTTEPKDWDRVVKSNRPVSTALGIIKDRVGAETFNGLYPAPGVALEGIKEAA